MDRELSMRKTRSVIWPDWDCDQRHIDKDWDWDCDQSHIDKED